MGLSGAVEVIWCTCITLITPALLPQSIGDIKLWLRPIGSTGHGGTWDRASVITFSFPLGEDLKSLQSWTG